MFNVGNYKISFRMNFSQLSKVERTKAPERKRTMTDSKLASGKKLLESGSLPKDVVKDLGVSLATLYRWIPAT